MRTTIVLLLAILMYILPAAAELRRIELGGELRIRARGNMNYQNTSGQPARTLIPDAFVVGRPLGPDGLASRFRFDDRGEDRHYVEMVARLDVTARFTDDILAFIEFESANRWGTDFRSSYVTGLDRTGGSDISLTQSYIEASSLFGLPLRVRLGRQTINLGKGWLVGELITSVRAMPFDAVRFTYHRNALEIDAWASKVSESLAGDDDIDFYGVYGTYTGLESVNASLYWMYIRDGRDLEHTRFGPVGEALEALLGYDEYGTTGLHTAGTRLWGGVGGFDFDWELAYQFGDAGQPGFGFGPVPGGYGDDSAAFGAFGSDLELGYTFDARWQPRVYLGGVWMEGEDNRYIDLFQWLNPFREGEASVSFNRLFSHGGKLYSYVLDGGQTMSNFQAVRLGVEMRPSAKLLVFADLEQFWVDEPFRRPASLPLFSFWTTESDDDLGLVATLYARYAITDELWVRVRWEHLFAGRAISDGNFSDRNGLMFLQGSDDDDADYLEAMIGIKF